jgi:hypothetical protein
VYLRQVLEKHGNTDGQNITCFCVFRLMVYESGGGGRVLHNILVEFGRYLLQYLEVKGTMLLKWILEIVQGSVERIRLADERDTWCAVAYTVANLRFP